MATQDNDVVLKARTITNSARGATVHFHRLQTNASQQFFCILQGWRKAFRGSDTILISGSAVADTSVTSAFLCSSSLSEAGFDSRSSETPGGGGGWQ